MNVINNISIFFNTYLWLCVFFAIISNIFMRFNISYNKKMKKRGNAISPIVSEILNTESLNEEEKQEKLNKLYKDNKYNVLLPIFFKICYCIYSVILIYVFTLISSGQHINSIYQGFFWIDNVFERIIDIRLAALYSGVVFFKRSIPVIIDYIKRKKEDNKQLIKTLGVNLISFIISFATAIICNRFLTPIITIYLIINALIGLIINSISLITSHPIQPLITKKEDDLYGNDE